MFFFCFLEYENMSAIEYLQELVDERDKLNPSISAHSIRLLEDEIEKVQNESEGNHPPSSKSNKQPELYKEQIIQLVEKIFLPIEEYPKFNFVGKIIGPKGSTLKNIVALTRTKISVLGQGSTRDREKEEELSQSGDAKHEHFKEPLHVLIQVEAPLSDAHERVANAIEEINKCMAPEMGDMHPGEIQYAMTAEAAMNHKLLGMQPMFKVGIPPPGAIMLNEQHQVQREISRSSGGGRRGGRGGGAPRFHVM